MKVAVGAVVGVGVFVHGAAPPSKVAPAVLAKHFGMRPKEDAEALMVENSVHEQLSQFLRVSLATCGANGVGALARGDCWAWIFGMITIWVDDEESAKLSEENPERFPQREAYELADIRVVLKGKELKVHS